MCRGVSACACPRMRSRGGTHETVSHVMKSSCFLPSDRHESAIARSLPANKRRVCACMHAPPKHVQMPPELSSPQGRRRSYRPTASLPMSRRAADPDMDDDDPDDDEFSDEAEDDALRAPRDAGGRDDDFDEFEDSMAQYGSGPGAASGAAGSAVANKPYDEAVELSESEGNDSPANSPDGPVGRGAGRAGQGGNMAPGGRAGPDAVPNQPFDEAHDLTSEGSVDDDDDEEDAPRAPQPSAAKAQMGSSQGMGGGRAGGGDFGSMRGGRDDDDPPARPPAASHSVRQPEAALTSLGSNAPKMNTETDDESDYPVRGLTHPSRPNMRHRLCCMPRPPYPLRPRVLSRGLACAVIFRAGGERGGQRSSSRGHVRPCRVCLSSCLCGDLRALPVHYAVQAAQHRARDKDEAFHTRLDTRTDRQCG